MQIRPRKLELGCGMRPAPGYLHQDITAQEGVALDFTCNPWEIDLPSGSVDEVIALGIVEHLRFTEVDMTLRHVASLLAPGGVFLFDVPDMRVWSEYLYNVTHGMSDKNPFTVEHVWSTMYGWQRWPGDEHKSGWTGESILEAVDRAGLFGEVTGPEIFTERGFVRGRFSRPGDAHVYVRAQRRAAVAGTTPRPA